MHISLHDLLWPALLFATGIYCLWSGLKANKFKEKRQAGISMTLMAICAFIWSVLETLCHASNISLSIKQNISKTLLVIDGVWLGILIVMICFGHFELLKSRSGKDDKDLK